MLVYPRVPPRHHVCRYPFIHLGGVRRREKKCLAQENNTMSPIVALTWSKRSGAERTAHEAAVSLNSEVKTISKTISHMWRKLINCFSRGYHACQASFRVGV